MERDEWQEGKTSLAIDWIRDRQADLEEGRGNVFISSSVGWLYTILVVGDHSIVLEPSGFYEMLFLEFCNVGEE